MIGVTTAAGASLAGVLGLILGSFLNVVAYRLPRGESLAAPGVALPRLRHADQAVRQRARCSRGCCCAAAAAPAATSIAWRYPLVELATALLMALTVVVVGTDRGRLARPRVRAAARAGDGHRHRLPDHPEQADDRRRDRRAGDPRAHATRRPPRAPDSRRSRPAGSCSSPRSPTRRAWAWATSSWRSSWACSWAATSASRCSSRSSPARSSASRSWRARAPRRVARRRSRSARSWRFGGVVGLLAGEPVVDWYLRTFA